MMDIKKKVKNYVTQGRKVRIVIKCILSRKKDLNIEAVRMSHFDPAIFQQDLVAYSGFVIILSKLFPFIFLSFYICYLSSSTTLLTNKNLNVSFHFFFLH